MDFPPITGLDDVVLQDSIKPAPPVPVILAGTAESDAERMDMWQYFVDHIDEFEVAKAIVDHFDAHPKDLHDSKIVVDAFALFLRAKITLKRQAVAYVTAQAAVAKAREQSRSLRSVARAIGKRFDDVYRAIEAQPQALALMAVAVVIVALR
jgi:hypothetical protein